MDGMNFIITDRRHGLPRAAGRGRWRDAAMAFAILAAVALATFAGVVALDAYGMAPATTVEGAYP